MTIRMPLPELERDAEGRDSTMSSTHLTDKVQYKWVGRLYKTAVTYNQYLENRQARQRYLQLKKMEEEGRVKREPMEYGFIYNDYKIKHSFYVENVLIGDFESHHNSAARQPQLQRMHTEIDNPEGADLRFI